MQPAAAILDNCTLRSIFYACHNQALSAQFTQLRYLVVGDSPCQDEPLGGPKTCGKYNSLEDAQKAFYATPQQDVHSWNALIAAHVRHKQGKHSFQLFAQMQLEGILFDNVTCVCILKACATQSAIAEGRRLHTLILGSNFHSDVILANTLLNMYGKCGSLEDAQRTFDKMSKRNTISWNVMIAAYTLHGEGKEALDLFEQMQGDGMMPDKVTFISTLSACANELALTEGSHAHKLIIERGLELDLVVQNALVNMYGKCGNVEAARRIFDDMPQENVITWNSMISAYTHSGIGMEALQLFKQMQQGGIISEKITFLSILSACIIDAALVEGKRVHTVIVGSHLELDVVVSTALINMYSKCGSIEDAGKMFHSMPERNVISWNTMISAYAQYGQGKEAISLFWDMQREGVMPSKVTFISVLDACSNQCILNECKRLHVLILCNKFQSDAMVGNALLNMYGKCCSVDDAWNLFDRMPRWNEVSWNVMIAIYAQNGHGKKALQLFDQMQEEGVIPSKITFVAVLDACGNEADIKKGTYVHAIIVGSHVKSDVILGNAVLNLYSKCGCMDMAWQMFENLPEQNVISWTAIIAGYSQIGQCSEALLCFNQMCQVGVMPNKITFVSVLSACTSQAARAEGEQIHALIVSCGFQLDIILGNALINMYGKCGSLEVAQRIFDNMLELDTVSWTSMIAAYSQHGQGKAALKMFYCMQREGVKPNKITFLSVLSACSHTGLVEEGYHWFVSMETKYGITPTVDHINCMIDLFGRAGRLDEAENFIRSMPLQPTFISMMALLSACKYQADVGRGERIAKHACKLDPSNCAPYVMLSNIYAAVGRVDDAEKVMNTLRFRGLKKHLNVDSISI